MAYQSCFKRYEIKYMLSLKQKEELEKVMKEYMKPNAFFRSSIRNVYYDTANFRLIRQSLEKPVYKEKLRIRSYKQLGKEEDVFVELKKKYNSVVYKRRLTMPLNKAIDWIDGNTFEKPETQIGNEIEYFCSYYGELIPQMFISYDRESYEGIEDKEFRITFDRNILARREDVDLTKDISGKSLIPDDCALMEIKITNSMPLWLTNFLTKNHINKVTFSKYGTAYRTMVLEKGKEENK